MFNKPHEINELYIYIYNMKSMSYTYTYKLGKLCRKLCLFRALALGNANAKSKENLAFLSPNPSASENGTQHY